MNDVLRGKLVELIRQQGPGLLEDRARLEGLLWLAIGEHGYGMFALMGALERHIPQAILTAPNDRRNADLFDKLVRRVVADLDVDEPTAQWAVESWDLAVHDLPQQTPLPPPRAEAKPAPKPAPPPRPVPKPSAPDPEQIANVPLLSLDEPDQPTATPSDGLKASDPGDRQEATPIPFVVPVHNVERDSPIFLSGHREAVTCLACSADGQVIATGSADHTLILWNANGTQRATLTCKDRVLAVAFAPNSRLLASASADGSIQLWDVQRGQGCGLLPCDPGWPRALAFAPDGKTLLAGGRDGTARLWRVGDGQALATLASHGDELLAVAFGPSGLVVATAGEDRKARLWDVSRHIAWVALTGHHEAVTGVAFSPDGKLLATVSRDGAIKLWNAVTGREIAQLEVDRQQFSEVLRCVAFAPDGRTLAAGAEDDAVHVWDVANRQQLTSFTGCGGPVVSVAYTPDGRSLLAAGADGLVRRWPVPAPRARPLYDHPSRRPTPRPSGRGKKAGAIGGVISGVVILLLIALRVIFGGSNRPNNVHMPQFKPPQMNFGPQVNFPKQFLQEPPRALFGNHAGGVTSVAVSPDGTYILSGGFDNEVRLWNFDRGEQVRQLGELGNNRHTNHIMAVAFSPDGSRALSASLDGTVKLWDVTTGNWIRDYRHDSGVTSVAFSRDGKQFISGCGFDKVTYTPENLALNQREQLLWDRAKNRSGAVYVWEVDNGDNTVLKTPAPGDQISSVTFSGDGRYIIGGCFDKTVYVWDAKNFGRLHQLKGHQGEVFTVAAVPAALDLPNLNRVVSGATKLGKPEDFKKANPPQNHLKHHVRVWDLQTGQETFQFPTHEVGILSAAVSPDGGRLLTTGFDRVVYLWDLNTGQKLREWRTNCLVNCVTFSPDGRFAVWGGWDGHVQVWRLRE